MSLIFPSFLDTFGSISFSATSFASLVFMLVSLFTLVSTIVLFFHWKKYGMGGAVIALMEVVYLGGSAALLAVAFFSLK
jgi:hypothetical protein